VLVEILLPQTAWIMNKTLRENILFGREFDKYLYDRVIEACALKQDLGTEFFSKRFYMIKKFVSRYASSKRSN
jgi:hypothetical protein